jgi:hypothetical protein
VRGGTYVVGVTSDHHLIGAGQFVFCTLALFFNLLLAFGLQIRLAEFE